MQPLAESLLAGPSTAADLVRPVRTTAVLVRFRTSRRSVQPKGSVVPSAFLYFCASFVVALQLLWPGTGTRGGRRGQVPIRQSSDAPESEVTVTADALPVDEIGTDDEDQGHDKRMVKGREGRCPSRSGRFDQLLGPMALGKRSVEVAM
jgi:hypothetical protein